MIQDNKPQTQDRAAEWMWSGLCGWGSLCQRRCRRTEFLLRDPQTLLFSCWWTLQREQSVCYCVWMSNWRESRSNSRTDHYIQTHAHYPVPSCWCSYMTLIHTHHNLHSTPAPSNSVHSHSLYTTPDTHQQICLDDQDTSGLYPCKLSLCCSQTDGGVYSLCSDPEWTDGNLMEIKHIRIRNYESVWSFHVSELFMFSVSSVYQYRWADILQIIIYIINYKTL